ncbi:Hypothetical protein NGAL_HAMBI1145_40910 [Neorhizobium galegae bv. officinalis]|uniref:DUF4112 domain-containing protein n=1 Tax=Neorhizobium galegae bv. officinalis TaxID=323656 RepID=A0A0T7FS95_NEOGA|nr:DUF4112 domain-containing protein [Neorhizobium galegae]CDZ37886.1 Hypothetical protein NGAL_HAMBI1145_40910 [Neorhizobium galegae bv. officinalis]
MTARTWEAGSNETLADRTERLRRLRRLSGIARLMDTAIGIPGTRIRFGADSVFGLIPLVGDAGGALVGLYIVNEARKLGLPPAKLTRMLGNVAADSVLGCVPLAGDVFDLFFKSHRRNVKMILDHFEVHPDELRER